MKVDRSKLKKTPTEAVSMQYISCVIMSKWLLSKQLYYDWCNEQTLDNLDNLEVAYPEGASQHKLVYVYFTFQNTFVW